MHNTTTCPNYRYFLKRWNMSISISLFLPPATKLGQGNIFRILSTRGGGWQGQHAWWGATHGSGVCMAGGIHGRVHVWQGGSCMAGGPCVAYSQWAGGTHPTGMHSCCLSNLIRLRGVGCNGLRGVGCMPQCVSARSSPRFDVLFDQFNNLKKAKKLQWIINGKASGNSWRKAFPGIGNQRRLNVLRWSSESVP